MSLAKDIYIVSAVRTPFSRFGGALRQVHSLDLGVAVIKEALSRPGLPGDQVDEVYYGMCIQSEAAIKYNVLGRQAMLHAGLPPDTLSLTVDRACCSSLVSVQLCCKSILLGEASVCLAVGAENMSNTPVVMNGHRWGTGLASPTMVDHLNPIMYVGFNSLAADAGEVALEHDVTREMQDQWAYGSQMRYQAAKQAGKFKLGEELMPIPVPQRKGDPVMLEEDEFPKPFTTVEKLATLRTVYGSPTVTAGNSPGLDAGAAAMILVEGDKARALGLKPLGKIVSYASAARDPRTIAEVPAYAIQKALGRAGLALEAMDVIEINEAFASMPLVSTKILSQGDQAKWEALQAKTNPNGGAIAVGHPVGASGARVTMTAMYELRRRGGGLGVAAICGGLAQGDAAVIQVDEDCL